MGEAYRSVRLAADELLEGVVVEMFISGNANHFTSSTPNLSDADENECLGPSPGIHEPQNVLEKLRLLPIIRPGEGILPHLEIERHALFFVQQSFK